MSTPWGQGRIEAERFENEVSLAFGAGQSLKEIYSELKTVDRVTVSYETFRFHVKRIDIDHNKSCSSSWGQARTEVIAQRSQIRAALIQGRPLKSIYDELKAGGRVSGTYQAFHKNVKRFCTPPRPGASTARPTLASDRPQTKAGPTLTSAQSEVTVPSKAPATVSTATSNPPSPRQSPASPPPGQSPAEPRPKPGEISLMERISGKKSLFVVNRHVSRKEVEHGPD